MVETLVEPLVEEPTADGTGLAPLGLGDGSVGENDLATLGVGSLSCRNTDLPGGRSRVL